MMHTGNLRVSFILPEKKEERWRIHTLPHPLSTNEWDVTATRLLKADFLFCKKSLQEIQGHVS